MFYFVRSTPEDIKIELFVSLCSKLKPNNACTLTMYMWWSWNINVDLQGNLMPGFRPIFGLVFDIKECCTSGQHL